MLRKCIKHEYLGWVISLGLTLGFTIGIIKAVIFIHSNRYLELGMYGIALSYLSSILNYFLLVVPIASLLIFLAISLFVSYSNNFFKDKIRAKTYVYYTVIFIILIGLFLTAFYKFTKSDWYPTFLSLRGISYNILLTLFFISFGFLVFRTLPRIRQFLFRIVPKVFHFRLAFFIVFLVLLLNGAYYYHRLQSDRDGLNVLLITVDTLRHDHLGVYGYMRDTSPNIDQLAKDGILFSHAVAQWPKTTPSFASMLTSTYGRYNGVVRNPRQEINSYFVLLAESLKNAHYNTVGIITNPNLAKAYNFNQGFDTYIEVWRKFESQEAEHVSEYALSWLESNSHKGKFFMWLHYLDPHFPYMPPENYDSMYVGDEHYDSSEKIRTITPSSGVDVGYGGIFPDVVLDNNHELDFYIAQYDAEIRYKDEEIGKVLDSLESMGLDENTIIVFTSDHGEALGEHNYYFDHGLFSYDDCVRVPLILEIPGFKSAVEVIDHPVELINIKPTILDILNIPVNQEAQGKSMVPLMLGKSDSIPNYAFTEAGTKPDYQSSIRTKKWKLIYIPDKGRQRTMQGMPFELYDIEKDPKELRNLVNIETKIAEELKKELFAWMESADRNDTLPSPEKVNVDKESEEILRSLGYIQ